MLETDAKDVLRALSALVARVTSEAKSEAICASAALARETSVEMLDANAPEAEAKAVLRALSAPVARVTSEARSEAI